MSSPQKRFYDLLEWDAINRLVKQVDGASDNALAALEAELGGLVTDAIASTEMAEHQTMNLEDKDVLSPDDQDALERKRFALIHIRARRNRLIALHGTVRGELGLDPVFMLKVQGEPGSSVEAL